MEKERYKLYLYVAGQTQKSKTAIANLQQYWKDHLADNYTIKVIDLRVHSYLAGGEQIIATPTLIKKLPEPMRIQVGDLGDKDKSLVGINLIPG